MAKQANAPKQGTITGNVWVICNNLFAVNNTCPTRGAVVAAGVAAGINVNTVTTQYQAWRAFCGFSTASAPRVQVPCMAVPPQA